MHQSVTIQPVFIHFIWSLYDWQIQEHISCLGVSSGQLFFSFYLHFASIHNRHTRQNIGNNQTFTNTMTKQEQKSTGWYNATVKQQHITSGWGSYIIIHYHTVCLICILGTKIQVLSCSAHERWKKSQHNFSDMITNLDNSYYVIFCH